MKRRSAFMILVCGLLVTCGSQEMGNDSQWRGPERSGVYSDVDLLKEWPENGPELIFSVVGLANASPDSLHIISSFKVNKGRGPFWSRPTIYNGILFIRHGDVLLAYNIKE